MFCYTGPMEEAETALAPIKSVGELALYGIQECFHPCCKVPSTGSIPQVCNGIGEEILSGTERRGD